MPRSTNGPHTRARRKRVMKQAKGYFGLKKNIFPWAQEAVDRAGQYAYRHRKTRKRDFRSLWIIRLNAAVREHGLTYSRFIQGLHAANIALDRKQLSEMAIHDAVAFKAIVDQARAALPANTPPLPKTA